MQEYTYQDFEIYDSHAHIFPEKISEKASKNIGKFYDIEMNGIGSSECLLKSGAEINVKKYLVCSTATVPEQVIAINSFIKSECESHDCFFGFGTLHPDMESMEEEIERVIALGLHGIKLHPDFQEFNIDSPSAYKMYELLEGRLPVLFHTGDNRYEFSRPHRLAKVADDFPKLKIIAAHMGGYQCWKEATETLKGYENIRFDCSSTMQLIPKESTKRLINYFGVDSCFFGCDFPMWSHADEFSNFLALGLSYEENRKILSENFKDFFGLN